MNSPVIGDETRRPSPANAPLGVPSRDKMASASSLTEVRWSGQTFMTTANLQSVDAKRPSPAWRRLRRSGSPAIPLAEYRPGVRTCSAAVGRSPACELASRCSQFRLPRQTPENALQPIAKAVKSNSRPGSPFGRGANWQRRSSAELCDNAPKRGPTSNGDHSVGLALSIGIPRGSASAPVVTLDRTRKNIATSMSESPRRMSSLREKWTSRSTVAQSRFGITRALRAHDTHCPISIDPIRSRLGNRCKYVSYPRRTPRRNHTPSLRKRLRRSRFCDIVRG